MSYTGLELYKIMNKAQEEAEEEKKRFVKARSIDGAPETIPPEWQQDRVYYVSLVRAAIKEYHQCLSEELKKEGLDIPKLSE